MNLILCSKDCVHQQDGCCKLEANAAPTGSHTEGCCYYQKIRPAASKKPHKNR
ncbi:hypothetical protein [Massiliimalia massiliensis]|uniref:hypothetical protein n=1 Tax=Massiliimalia massiliensis TaxID=1852384 RepID=UPI001356564A|nr:hypothetical protein [Massiliimalia massiliensis]